ncbi:MAG: GNAT family N-acetyltransferase [Deltaproteobacteria bacterium]|nr:MAG: GNAT family N-acetyltransferase [Deltaproteobacteria bacterium]RLB85071.1 MAG: GNAT family N-acetyltransferase [Deltaproteobacteria bacterium]
MQDQLPDLIIRNIRSEDAEQISKIQSSITKSGPPIDFKHIIETKLQGSEDVSFVAEIDGKVAGYMISYVVYGGFGLEKSAWIATLGVDPKFMGQGIGKRLAQEIFKEYSKKGIRYIFTSVRWDSADLLSFFKTLGFDRSDFINLRKELGP